MLQCDREAAGRCRRGAFNSPPRRLDIGQAEIVGEARGACHHLGIRLDCHRDRPAAVVGHGDVDVDVDTTGVERERPDHQ